MSRAARALFALVAIATVARARVAVLPPPTLEIVEQRLDNGLYVLVAPDPTVSSVVVHVRYTMGAGDEPAHHAGYTHLVEKLMSAGSVHVKPGELDARIDAAGGWSSSSSDADRLSVFEQAPSGALELALFLEAERMAGLADGIRDEGLASAKASIAGERRAAYDDAPMGLAPRAVREALWPAGHPNARDLLGDGRAVPRATRRSVRAFVRDHVTPRDTVIVIAGRVDTAATLELVRRYFGWIPSRPQRARDLATVEASATPITRTVKDPVAKAVVAYRASRPFASDAIDLEVAARVLAGGRASRLHRALVQTGLATEVHAEMTVQRRGNELRIQATAGDGIDPARLAATIRDEVGALRERALPDDVVRRAATALEADLLFALEGLAFRADMIATWSINAGNPRFLDTHRGMLAAVTADSVQRAARYWLAAPITVIGRPEAK